MTTLNYSGTVTLYTLSKTGSVSTQNFIISVSNALISNTNRVYKTTVKSSVINQVLLTSAIESLDDSGFLSKLV